MVFGLRIYLCITVLGMWSKNPFQTTWIVWRQRLWNKLAGLHGEETIAELCRREGIAQSIYYKWSKEFLEAGKRRLSGDNGSSYVSGELAEWLGEKKMGHVRGAPYHPQTQGALVCKICAPLIDQNHWWNASKVVTIADRLFAQKLESMSFIPALNITRKITQ